MLKYSRIWIGNFDWVNIIIVINLLSRFCLVEHVNSCETHWRCISLVVVDVCWLEFGIALVLVLWLSGFLNEFVGDYLSHLDTVVRFVTEDFPFENCFLRMELHSEKWILSCLPDTDKFLVVRWRSFSNDFPETVQSVVSVVSASQDSPVMVKVGDTISSR